MNEEIETLMCLAAAGELDAAGQGQWAALRAEQPALEAEMRALQATMARMHRCIENAEEHARCEAPEELPPYLLAPLETARREVFGGSNPATADGSVKRFLRWLTEVTRLPAPMLATAAALVVAAVSWWTMQGRSGGLPVVATMPFIFKDAVASVDLPMAAPGDNTGLTDPSVVWVSLSREPVTVAVLDAEGTLLVSAEAAGGFIDWADLTQGRLGFVLKPGESYLFRLRQGETTSERVVHVKADAVPLVKVATGTGAFALAKSWLDNGRAADALILTQRLAAVAKSMDVQVDGELAAMRSRALSAALNARKPAAAK